VLSGIAVFLRVRGHCVWSMTSDTVISFVVSTYKWRESHTSCVNFGTLFLSPVLNILE
jgi:hypothetical protein